MLKRYCFEPIKAKPRVDPGSIDPFSGNVPAEADPDAVAQQRASAERVAQKCEWLLWGSGVVEPGHASDYMTGRLVRFDDHGIVATVRLFPEQTAKRLAACVNACQGIDDPEATVPQLRQLLTDLCAGNATIDDIRITSLLDRMSREENP